MTHRILLVLGLGACAVHNPAVETTTITHLRTQDALVMAPEAPVGFGTSLAPGMTSLTAMAGLTGTQAPTGNVGQHAIPVSGGLRGAAGATDGVEVTVSGTLGSPNIDPGPLAEGLDRPEGVLGRGAVGMRGFVPLRSEVELGMSLDVGAEASSFARTDTVIVHHSDAYGTTEDRSADTTYDLRVKPHVRSAMILRAPLPGLPVSVIGGGQVQNWTVYWAEAQRTETCTTYALGDVVCHTSGSIPTKPSKQVAIFTPTVGASLLTDAATIHLQAFAHLGPDAVDTVPWGAMLGIELFGRPKSDGVATNGPGAPSRIGTPAPGSTSEAPATAERHRQDPLQQPILPTGVRP